MIDVAQRPSLHLLAGPNGAGKSSLVADTIGPITGLPFVNADEIAAELWPNDAILHAKEASQLAEQQRDDYIAEGVSFIAETVFSHPSKLDLIDAAVAAGYTVALHAVMVPEDLSVQRVAHRVASGGHAVPEDKIRQRYQRLWPLVVEAIGRCHSARGWDNSRHDGPADVALFAYGLPVGPCTWPAWTPQPLTTRWPGPQVGSQR